MKPIIRLDVTSRCNLKCNSCYSSDKTHSDLPKEKIFDIISKIKNFGAKRIIFSGGEPFLRNDLKEIIIFAYKNKLQCEIVTNGTLLKNDDTSFIKKYVFDISISLDGHNEEINGITRPKYSFKKVISSARILRQNKIKFNLITTLSNSNYHYIDKIILFGKKIGARNHAFIRFIPLGRGSRHKDLYISDEEWPRVIKRLKKSKRLLFDNKYIYGNCGAGKDILCILSNGDMTVCTRKFQKKWILGSILKDNINEIWESSVISNKARTNKINCIDCI